MVTAAWTLTTLWAGGLKKTTVSAGRLLIRDNKSEMRTEALRRRLMTDHLIGAEIKDNDLD